MLYGVCLTSFKPVISLISPFLGLNLGLDNLTNAILEAKSISSAFASLAVKGAGIVLDYFEIGNEGM